MFNIQTCQSYGGNKPGTLDCVELDLLDIDSYHHGISSHRGTGQRVFQDHHLWVMKCL